jgi:mannitol/fructose-specific phosphotransferase system IIA component (Ntr-type)
MELLRKALIDGWFLLDLDESDMASIVHRALDVVVARGVLPAERRDEVEALLLEREQQVSTAIGNAVAVPHTYLDAFSEPVILFARLSRPVNLGAPDRVRTRFVFMLLGPSGAEIQHLDTLASIARLAADDEYRYDAGVARTQRDLVAALDRFNARIGPLPTAGKEPTPQPFTPTGRLFGGWIADIRRRLPHYASDYRDGLHAKCVASTLFLFFACLAPAVAFGGIMAQLTGNQIGAVEMLVASAACGIVYALSSGQPLIILGGTGPLLVFTAVLYRLCIDLQIPFLPTYAWVGLWTALLLLVLAATDASRLMRYFTRFTDEIFAALISTIFIYEAIKALVQIWADLDVRQHYDTALLSVLLAFGTFYVAMSLSRFRRSPYLLRWIREFVADFGPTIALAAMTLVAVLLHEVYLDALPAPGSFGTTSCACCSLGRACIPRSEHHRPIGQQSRP